MSAGFPRRVALGRTGLMVSPLGLGSSYGVSRRACLRAFDAGINYFFWGSTRTPQMAAAIRELSASHRDELVVVLQCYVRWASLIPRSIDQGLEGLGLDRVDILLLGWYDRPPAARVLRAVQHERERGRFRFLAISSHQRPLFRDYLAGGHYDVFHLRYNAAHPGAEQDIFPHLPDEGGPGIVSFTNTRWGDLLRPKMMPRGAEPPSAADCYRFALSDPHVHVAICGPSRDEQLAQALTALDQGPLSAEEQQRIRAIGRHVHDQRTLRSWLV
jgi:aryl-alcohol dehydrogenase-like predicted oxidoreductase